MSDPSTGSSGSTPPSSGTSAASSAPARPPAGASTVGSPQPGPTRTATPPQPETVTFTLDGREVSAHKGEMVIAAAERAGVFIPRFCYHPRMKSVGVCRMCLVEISGPRGATLQPACFVAANDGMEVVTTSEKVKKAQDGVLEFLLVNHPLDCPVCDKGGECPLQDQTLAYGPGESRFVEEKRHFEKPIPLSELVLLDRERCIQCSRCTRFAAEVAGEAQIDFAGRGELVEVAAFPDRPFTSYFSGNTVQICPVGALTATPYRFTARPWDLEQVESTCTTCSFGCRAAVQSSAGRLTRLLGLDADPVNQSWLCDKGRFAYEAVNGEVEEGPGSRLTEPLVRKDGELVPASWGEALREAADRLSAARAASGGAAVAALGGARLANEDAYAWARLLKGVVRTDSVDCQLGDGLPAEAVLGLPRATIDDACHARTVVLLTGDPREEVPVLFLRLRGATVEGGTRLVELSPQATSLTPYATSLRLRPGDLPAAARALAGDDDVRQGLASHHEGPSFSDEVLAEARRHVTPDAGEEPGAGVVVVVGRPSLAEDAGLVVEAARHLAGAWPAARFLPALRRGNAMGAIDMGLAPGLLPGRVPLEGVGAAEWYGASWGGVPAERGLDATGILQALAEPAVASDPAIRALVLLGADPLDDFPDRRVAARALENVESLVVVASHRSATTDRADVVLPAATQHERSGTTTNLEGRVSRLAPKVNPPGIAWPDWMIASELAFLLGSDFGLGNVTEILDEIERLAPSHRGLAGVVDSPAARDGVVVPLTGDTPPAPPAVEMIDPIAVPGVESAETQGAPLRVGAAEPPHPDAPGEGAGPDRPALTEASGGPPAVLGPEALAALEAPHVPPPDGYALRLVAGRRLYDLGSAVVASPALAVLAGEAVLRANSYDLDRLGATSGDRVRVRAPGRSLELPVAVDDGLARGVAALDFNVPLTAPDGSVVTNPAALLIDSGSPVTEFRWESL